MKILLTGGGTLGSVSPLLAISASIRKKSPETSFLLIGSQGKKKEREQQMADACAIPFKPIPSGKFRRYFSLENIGDLFRIIHGFFSAYALLKQYNPHIVLSAGSFVSVPVAYAASLQNIPILIHQQDVQKSLANKLMEGIATHITVALPSSYNEFDPKKTSVTGNPVHPDIMNGNAERAQQKYGLATDRPVVLILGGSSGASGLNAAIETIAPQITPYAQILHVTGTGKRVERKTPDYQTVPFIKHNIQDVYAASDLVITRCGMATLTELAACAKPVFLVPIPNSHQEKNATYFHKHYGAAIIQQSDLTRHATIQAIINAVQSQEKRFQLAKSFHMFYTPDSTEKIWEIIQKLVKS